MRQKTSRPAKSPIHPLSLIRSERGMHDILIGMVILSSFALGTWGLSTLTSSSEKMVGSFRERMEFQGLINRLTFALSDPANCALNLDGMKAGSDLRRKGVRVYDSNGKVVMTLIDASKSVGQPPTSGVFKINSLRLGSAQQIPGAGPGAALANLEITGIAQGHSFFRSVPVYLKNSQGGIINGCRATMLTKSGKTLEQMACESIEDLGLTDKYGTRQECETYLISKYLAGG